MHTRTPWQRTIGRFYYRVSASMLDYERRRYVLKTYLILQVPNVQARALQRWPATLPPPGE